MARFGQVWLVTLYHDKAVLDMRTVQKILFFPPLKYNLFEILKAAKKARTESLHFLKRLMRKSAEEIS